MTIRMFIAAAALTALSASLAAGQPAESAKQHPPYDETVWPAEVRKVFDYARTECGAGEGVKVTFAPDTVRKIDLTGDGRDDYIVDLRDTKCSEYLSAYCGTGGCWTEILVTMPNGTIKGVFADVVRKYEILPRKGKSGPTNGPVTMTFDLHGGRCGRAGGDACPKTRRITTRPFEFK